MRLKQLFSLFMTFIILNICAFSQMGKSFKDEVKIDVNEFSILLEKKSGFMINKVFDKSDKLLLDLEIMGNPRGGVKKVISAEGEVYIYKNVVAKGSTVSLKYKNLATGQLCITEEFLNFESKKSSQHLSALLMKKGAVKKSLSFKELGLINYLILDLGEEVKLYFIPHRRSESIHKNFSKSKLALQRDYMIHISKIEVDVKQMAKSYILAMKRSDYLQCESCE